jgi:hypothetical protein
MERAIPGASFWLTLLITAAVVLGLTHGGNSHDTALTTSATASPSCFVFGCPSGQGSAVAARGAATTSVPLGTTTSATAPPAAPVEIDGQYSIVSRVAEGGTCTGSSFRLSVHTSGVNPNRRITFTLPGGGTQSAALSPAYGFSFTTSTRGIPGTDSVSGSFNVRSNPITIGATESIRLNDGRSCKTTWSGRRVG